jgi:hypothetical protein
MRLLASFLLFFGLFGCVPRANLSKSANFIKTELYFGLNIPNGGRVEDPDFERFVDTCLSPRFAEGLTVLQAQGQWQDTASKKVEREDSRIVILLYPRKSRKAKNVLIEQARGSYQKSFEQQSVMRVDMPVRTSF